MNEVIVQNVFLVLTSVIRFCVLLLFVFIFYSFYYEFKVYLYLKNHRPETHRYLTGNDLPFLEKVTHFRIEKWYYSKMDEDDSKIREYKIKIKKAERMFRWLFFLFMFPMSLMVIIYYLSDFM